MKPVLLLVSGWGYPAHALEACASLLAEAFEVERFGLHEGVLLDAADPAAALAHHAQSRHPRPCLLGGWSTGGMVAADAALRMPAPPAGLVMISSTARFTATAGWDAGVPATRLRALRAALRTNADSALERFDSDAWHPAAVPRDIRILSEHFRKNVTPGSLARGLDILGTTDLRTHLPALGTRALWLHGEYDRVILPDSARASMRPQDRLALLPGAGHALPLQNPGWCASQIRAWFSEFHA